MNTITKNTNKFTLEEDTTIEIGALESGKELESDAGETYDMLRTYIESIKITRP